MFALYFLNSSYVEDRVMFSSKLRACIISNASFLKVKRLLVSACFNGVTPLLVLRRVISLGAEDDRDKLSLSRCLSSSPISGEQTMFRVIVTLAVSAVAVAVIGGCCGGGGGDNCGICFTRRTTDFFVCVAKLVSDCVMVVVVGGVIVEAGERDSNCCHNISNSDLKS